MPLLWRHVGDVVRKNRLVVAWCVGLETRAVFVDHGAALMVALPLQGAVGGRFREYNRVARAAVDFLYVFCVLFI